MKTAAIYFILGMFCCFTAAQAEEMSPLPGPIESTSTQPVNSPLPPEILGGEPTESPKMEPVAKDGPEAKVCVICKITCKEGGDGTVEVLAANGCPAVGKDFAYDGGGGGLRQCQPVTGFEQVKLPYSPCLCDSPPCELRAR